MGVPTLRAGLIGQWSDGTGPDDVVPVCRFTLEGVAEGCVVGVPMTPEDLLVDQERAVDRMARAVSLAGPVNAIGLGSLCAVVAGRGEALAERFDVPVTNGGAATAWALLDNVRSVLARVGGDRPVAVVGARGPVGKALAECLIADGFQVRVDHPRAARGINAVACSNAAEAVSGCRVIVGAGPTGGTVAASSVDADAIVVDVAIPGTLVGAVAPGVTVLAGEAVSFPDNWNRGFWGWLYHVLSGYGPNQVFACLIEPLVLAVMARETPFSIGRTLHAVDVEAFGICARRLGFRPRLARGWRGVELDEILPVGLLNESR
jgi:predicted amino acid dehydrogenase